MKNNYVFNNKQIKCQEHSQNPHFICRNQRCLYENRYLVCIQEQCMNGHFNHPEDLVTFDLFYQGLLTFQKTQSKNYQAMQIKIRQSMNKLLHIRISVIQYIDTQIQSLKKRLAAPKQIPTIKDRIYLLKPNNLYSNSYVYSSDLLQFQTNQLQKQTTITINKTMSRLNRNVNSLMGKNIIIEQLQDTTTNVLNYIYRFIIQKRSYQFKIEGDILKIKQLLKTIPEHIHKVKIYLNQDTYGYKQYDNIIGSNLLYQYCQLENIQRYIFGVSALVDEISMGQQNTFGYLVQYRIMDRDNYFEGEAKRSILGDFCMENKKLLEFVVENKMDEKERVEKLV